MPALIIAKYREDVSWALPYKSTHTIYIYNKDENNANDEYIHLPNVGRESNTYLEHIVRNYHNLDDVNVFVQGNPFDHGHVDAHAKPERFKPFGISRPHDGEPACISRDESIWPQAVSVDLAKRICEIVGAPYQDNVAYHAGAMFAVTKECIQKHPKEVYEKLLAMSIAEPKFAWTVERLWPTIFS
jgi:hypothetical protein